MARPPDRLVLTGCAKTSGHLLIDLGLGDEPVKTLKAGETFYEPTGILHRVSRNPGTKGRTRVLAVILHPREARNIVLPASAGPTE
jgi:quercetin dioxygenase-like cupin family protein